MSKAAGKPSVCPVCGKAYFSRVSARVDRNISLYGLYRCNTNGKVYLHRIDVSP